MNRYFDSYGSDPRRIQYAGSETDGFSVDYKVIEFSLAKLQLITPKRISTSKRFYYHPNLINKKVCKQILVKNYFDDNEYIINDDISIQELYELLQNATLCDIIKLPPRLVLTIKGTNYHQTFFICDDYIKDDKRKIYRCKKNIEKELKKIIKDNRSHNGLERSEWQAVYSENISRGQLNRPLRTYYITTKAPSGNYVGGDGPSILADKNIPISLYWYKK